MTRPDIADIVRGLDLAQKVRLTAGADMWSVPGIPEAGIPGVTLTDGPNGARGSGLLAAGRETAACVPSGSALGATWDPELVREVGAVLGQEARTKGARILLAPTINLHRWPLNGRTFECYSEDPYLTGRIASGFVEGVQSQGVAATLKHLVGNESEFERTMVSSDIDQRTLRELYLLPFEMAVRDAQAWAVMTAYNRVNGRYCSEDAELLTHILRQEWGFEGVVMSDWLAAGETIACALAGLDLQMPGPDRFYGAPLAAAVERGEVPEEVVDAMVTRWLGLIDQVGAWDDEPQPERSVDLPEHRALARRAAGDAMVLLRNDGVLPLRSTQLRRVAVIGPNAAVAHLMGGGSAQLRPHYAVAPIEPLAQRLGDRLVHEQGCVIDKTIRPLSRPRITTPDGLPGITVEYFDSVEWEGPAVATKIEDHCRLLCFGAPVEGLDEDAYSFRARAMLHAELSGSHVFSLVQAGRARLLVGGEVVIDGIADPPPPGEAFFTLGSEERRVEVELEAGSAVEVVIEYASTGSVMLHGVKIGYQPPQPADGIGRAVAAAADADVAIVVVGTSDEWETEGHDRTSMDLPGEQDELVRRVCAANPRTVVVVNAGAPVTMDWAEDAGAVLMAWLGGQEMAAALDAVLFGEAEPAGRLPTTIPLRLEHGPAFGTLPPANHRVPYGEGLLMGYRWFATRQLPVRYPFGHGGSYTTFEWGAPQVSRQALVAGEALVVEVPVTNTGARRGAEVVQCYVTPGQPRLPRPALELKGFAKVWVDPGQTVVARIELDGRAFSHWDPGSDETQPLLDKLGDGLDLVPADRGPRPRPEPGWYTDPGERSLLLGRSVADIVAEIPVVIEARLA